MYGTVQYACVHYPIGAGSVEVVPASTGNLERPLKRRMPRAERREQLLDIALAIVVSEGYAAISMEAVAREADVAKTVAYDIFGDRAGLVSALLERTQERAVATAVSAIPYVRQADLLEQARAALFAYFEAVREDPDTWRLILIPAEGTPPGVRETVESYREMFRRQLQPFVADACERHGLKDFDVELAAHSILSGADEMARLVISDPERFTPERVTAHQVGILRMVLAGAD